MKQINYYYNIMKYNTFQINYFNIYKYQSTTLCNLAYSRVYTILVIYSYLFRILILIFLPKNEK